MTHSKHTPGPWYVRENKASFTIMPRGKAEYYGSIARLDIFDRANANLIAAAPELLGALEYFVDVVDFKLMPDLLEHPLYDKAIKAIAKARGE